MPIYVCVYIWQNKYHKAYQPQVNHLALPSSVIEGNLFDVTDSLLENLLEPTFCGMSCSAFPKSSGKKMRYFRTKACNTKQDLLIIKIRDQIYQSKKIDNRS